MKDRWKDVEIDIDSGELAIILRSARILLSF